LCSRFARQLFPLSESNPQADFLIYSCAAIGVLTALNLLGVRIGTTTQNVLTTVKVLGLLAIVVVGTMLLPRHQAPTTEIASSATRNFSTP
jgi:amino acid transporter